MFSISRFGQLTQNIPKHTFKKAVTQSKADKYTKSFKSWDLLMLLMFGQIQQVSSLRKLVSGYNVNASHLYHLNSKIVQRSTVCDALQKRSPEPFKAVCESLIKSVARSKRKELQDLTCLLDSTPIKLPHERFDSWADSTKTRRGRGLKVHVCYDLQQQAPCYANITNMNVNDITDAQKMPIQSQATYVFDKGYCDYNWWLKINNAGSHFVTRLKANAAVNVVESKKTPPEILSDDIVQFKNRHPGGGRINHYVDKNLRRIIIFRPDKKTPLTLITNDLERSALEISKLYKERWQIELLFKWLKQKLKLKSFFGGSKNAVLLQIYAALIAYILMILERKRCGFNGTLSEFFLMLQFGLFQREFSDNYIYRKRRKQADELRDRQPGLSFVF